MDVIVSQFSSIALLPASQATRQPASQRSMDATVSQYSTSPPASRSDTSVSGTTSASSCVHIPPHHETAQPSLLPPAPAPPALPCFLRSSRFILRASAGSICDAAWPASAAAAAASSCRCLRSWASRAALRAKYDWCLLFTYSRVVSCVVVPYVVVRCVVVSFGCSCCVICCRGSQSTSIRKKTVSRYKEEGE